MTDLPKRAGVVVVGGGVMGVSVAFHLAEAGVRDVLLLDRGPLGAGSTSRAAGGVRAQFGDELNVILGARSLELLGRLRATAGSRHRPASGGLSVRADAAGGRGRLRGSIELQHRYDVPSRLIDPA